MSHPKQGLAGRLPFYYGYVIVPVAMLAQIASSPGQTFAISAFTPALRDSLHFANSQLAAAYMFGTILAALPLSFIGPISDRWGIRATTVLVSLGLSAACFFASRVQGFYSLLVAFLMLRFLGQGALSLLSANIVSMWFQQHLGKVSAVMSVGMAGAFALVPVIMLESIARSGWRATYAITGAVISVTLVPISLLLLKNRPEDVGQLPDGMKEKESGAAHGGEEKESKLDGEAGIVWAPPELTLREAFVERSFWIIAVAMMVWALVGTGIVFWSIEIFDQRGIPADQSKLLFTTFSACMLAAQVVGGMLADLLPLNRLLSAGFVLLSAGTLAVIYVEEAWQVHVFAALFGTGQGIAIAANSTMWVRYFGRQHLGKIRGVGWCLTVAGSGCGPFIMGRVFDSYGEFDWGLWIFVAMLVPFAPLALLATPSKNRRPVALGYAA